MAAGQGNRIKGFVSKIWSLVLELFHFMMISEKCEEMCWYKSSQYQTSEALIAAYLHNEQKQ